MKEYMTEHVENMKEYGGKCGKYEEQIIMWKINSKRSLEARLERHET